ncbi:Alkaline phosphatase [BD1-7 clade bacterium]|uniref:Alkaline phosphatase n=1 Tax=BD1-7 clade bacterium TaxID=2029982 RepID=A0A5S9QE09_9GAMM|nr:Alkaline phosphatase [BD1-7 clade bacterium]CAA0116657.1 Alkaline phosphatase [BD1-7 clade bacterium]
MHKQLRTIAAGLLLVGIHTNVVADQVMIDKEARWSYLDAQRQAPANAQLPSFNASDWASGHGVLGYGDSGIETEIDYGSDKNNKNITTYFRHQFSVEKAEEFSALRLKLMRDDGAVVYLNGHELTRQNMPTGTITSSTLASETVGQNDEKLYHVGYVAADRLQNGENTLAVELHQRSPSSSDTWFDLKLIGISGDGIAERVRGPYLQTGTPDSVRVLWRTDEPATSCVHYGTAVSTLSDTVCSDALVTEHEVRLQGLNPATRYFYKAVSNEQVMAQGADNYFETSPVPGTREKIRIWAIGDAGTANANQRAVYNAYQAHTGDTYTNVWVMLGDNAYGDGTDDEYQRAVFDMYPQLLRQAVVWPTIGNHDAHTSDSATQSGAYFDIFSLPTLGEAGGLPSGTEAYYSYDYGNIHFIVLDSAESSRMPWGDMMRWMEADLQASDAEWTIAYWHHPPYTKGSHDSDWELQLIQMRKVANKMLKRYGVDLVLSGHSHSYERSKFIDGHYGQAWTFSNPRHAIDSGSGQRENDGAYTKPGAHVSNAGAVYIVAGSSGKKSGGKLNHKAMYASLNELGSMVIDVEGLTMDAVFIDEKGQVLDHFSIEK